MENDLDPNAPVVILPGNLNTDPAWAELSNAALALHVRVVAQIAMGYGPPITASSRLWIAEELVAAGLWEHDPEAGYRVKVIYYSKPTTQQQRSNQNGTGTWLF